MTRQGRTVNPSLTQDPGCFLPSLRQIAPPSGFFPLGNQDAEGLIRLHSPCLAISRRRAPEHLDSSPLRGRSHFIFRCLFRTFRRIAGGVAAGAAPASLPPSTIRYCSRIGFLANSIRGSRACRPRSAPGTGSSRDVRRHAVVRHGAPRMVLRRPAAGTRRRRRSRRAGRSPAPRTMASRSQILPRAVLTR